MKTILHVVNIQKDSMAVFEAITTTNGLSNWWSTKVSANEKVGGIVEFTFRGDFNPDMEILAMNKPKLLKWKCVSGHEPWENNTFLFALTAQGNTTQLKFIQVYAIELSDEQYGIYNFNWGYYLQSLKEYCETGIGKPYNPEY